MTSAAQGTPQLADLLETGLAVAGEHLPDGADVAGARPVIVLDDDPTGTQTVHDVGVVTAWGDDDLAWAFSSGRAGFFVLTNTRSLDPGQAARRTAEVADACRRVARRLGVDPVFLSRGDSTLRGHFPLETDVLAAGEAAAGRDVDAVVLVPAYIDAGRVTMNGVHRVLDADGFARPVGETEFARDATFGFAASSLPEWVEEKTRGAVSADEVAVITLEHLRLGGAHRVGELIADVGERGVVAADAARDDDLRILAEAVVRLETEGKRFIYRAGPSFVRARFGQTAAPPVDLDMLRDPAAGPSTHGLVVVGSHVDMTSRQLEELRAGASIVEFELDVSRLDDEASRAELVSGIVDSLDEKTVVLRTSRTLRRGRDAAESLTIAREVSAAVVDVVARVLARRRPAYLVAKGGITSSDLATEALGIRRAVVVGTVLPGIVSAWRAVDGVAPGLPYIVFAGNVGDDRALLAVVSRLDEARPRSEPSLMKAGLRS